MQMKKIIIIKNNDENVKIINRCIESTLNAATIQCVYNEEESKKINEQSIGFALTFVSKEGRTSIHGYEAFFIDMENEKELEQFFLQLKFLCDSSVRKIPYLKTSQGVEIKTADFLWDYENNKKKLMYGIIASLVYYPPDKYSTKNILNIVTAIFVRFAQSQTLENGNKRFTVLFTTAILSYFNIYIFKSWNDRANDYLNKWESVVTVAATGYYQKWNSEGLLENDLSRTNGQKIPDDELFNFVQNYLESIMYFKIF